MENNKFNRFYSNKSIAELIEKLRAHRTNSNKLDNEWFDALKVQLSERENSSEKRQVINCLFSDEFDQIKELEILNNQKTFNEKAQESSNNSSAIVNPLSINELKSKLYNSETIIHNFSII